MGEGQSKQGKRKDPLDQLLDASFEMKQQAKFLEKEAQKSQKQSDAQKARAKQFLDKGDMVSA